MISVVEVLKTEVDRTIQSLNRKTFEPDPIAGQHFSKIVSVMSSAYKRHGYILERAILEALRTNPDFEVWRDEAFEIPASADHVVDAALANPAQLMQTHIPYGPGPRRLQVDTIVFDKRTRSLQAYEIKRGSGLHDSGKRRSMLRDVLCIQILLKSYGEQRGLLPTSVTSQAIFYYGKCSIPKPFSLGGAELDGHFGYAIHDAVEEVNAYFRQQLFGILSG